MLHPPLYNLYMTSKGFDQNSAEYVRVNDPMITVTTIVTIIIIFYCCRDLLHCHHVHGRIQLRHHHHDPQLSPPDGGHP